MELALYQEACDARIRDPITPLRVGEDAFGEPRVISTFDFDYSEEGTIAAIQKGGHYSGQELIIFLTEITGIDINLYQPWENDAISQFTTMREGRERNVVMIASVPGHYETMAVATTFDTEEGDKFHGLQTVFEHNDPLFDTIERLPEINEGTMVEDLENNFVAQISPTLLALKNNDSSFSVFKRLWPGFGPSFQELLTLAFEMNDIPIPTEEDWKDEPPCFKTQQLMAKDLDIDLPTNVPVPQTRPGTGRATRGSTRPTRGGVVPRRSRREELELERALQESLETSGRNEQLEEIRDERREDDELQEAIRRSLEREEARRPTEEAREEAREGPRVPPISQSDTGSSRRVAPSLRRSSRN